MMTLERHCLHFVLALLLICALVTSISVAQSIEWRRTDGPYTGRVSALGSDSAGTWYASTTTTLWRSADRGASWIESGSSVWSIAPAPGNRVYACGPTGVTVSTDGGCSWMLTSEDPKMFFPSCLVPVDSAVILAGSASGGIRRSSNGGRAGRMLLLV